MADGIVRCADDDPNRCQGSDKINGQCNKLSMEGKDRCPMHIGTQKFLNQKAANGYQLDKWRARLDRLADAAGVRSLRDEIGMLKMTLESVMDACNDDSDLIKSSTRIGDLVLKIEKVVTSCHKLEKSTGMMLDKSAALQIAANIVSIIGEHIHDQELITAITDQIISQVLNVEFENND